jgi:hypothetical protein
LSSGSASISSALSTVMTSALGVMALSLWRRDTAM